MNSELDFEKRYRLLREIIETVVLTILMFLVIRFAVQNFNIEGTSMEPTLHNTELILVDKWTYLFHPPSRGDIIVFIAPPAPSQDYIKRIIAIPGDRISISGTTVIVDGVTLKETYIAPSNQGVPYPYKPVSGIVPADDYFVMGDNRRGSSDSRYWGYVPRKNIIGRAAFVYWPLGQDNNGFLSNASAVFANVHQPGVTSIVGNDNGITLSVDGTLVFLTPFVVFAFQQRKRMTRKSKESPIRNHEAPSPWREPSP